MSWVRPGRLSRLWEWAKTLCAETPEILFDAGMPYQQTQNVIH